MVVERQTTMTVPVAIKWDAGEKNWLTKAPSLEIVIRADSLEEATEEIEDQVRDAMEVGFGIQSPDLSLQIETVKASVSVGVFRRIDRSIFEFAAHETEKEMQRQGYDCTIEVEPHGEEVCDDA